jgi:hypothetical protein
VFTFSGIYTLPFGRGQQFLNRGVLLDELVGGWKLSATSRENTGAPFTPTMANNQTYAQAGSQFPNLIGNPLSVLTPGNNNDPTKQNGGPQTSTHTLQNWFNKYAYAAPDALTFGNVHRNSLYGPDYSDLSLSFGKTFKVLERYELTIKADARNALNHPAFGGPDSAIDDTLPAQITSVVNNGRHIQLYAHFQF